MSFVLGVMLLPIVMALLMCPFVVLLAWPVSGPPTPTKQAMRRLAHAHDAWLKEGREVKDE